MTAPQRASPAPPDPPPTVFKFGGSSVADAERIQRVARLVLDEPEPVVVVVSALGGVTDRLLDACRAILGAGGGKDGTVGDLRAELRARHLDVLSGIADGDADREALTREIDGVLERMGRAATCDWSERPAELRDEIGALGEDLSSRLVALAIRRAGGDATSVDAREVVRTDDRFGAARPLDDDIRELAEDHLWPLLRDGRTPVLGGFMGSTADGRTTTLGRGGSDFTASILGAALGSTLVHIWTDVDGLLSGDPRAVDHPRILEEIGYEEAVELSYFGARVIHPGAAKHAVSRGLALRIRNTFNPGTGGTLILSDRRGVAEIAAVAFKPNVDLIKVRSRPAAMPYGFLARVFGVLAEHELPVDLVATSHSSTAFTIDAGHELDAIREALSDFAEVTLVPGLATVTVVGHGLMEEPGIDALVFWAVERVPVHLISQASDVSLSFLVAQAEAHALVRKLHLTLIELRDAEGREQVE